MKARICIPTAGTGSRLGSIKKGLNKSLINVGGKPAISHIIEKFDPKSEFIIPVGYGAKEVKEYLTLAYPQHKFKFIEIDKYQGAGSGLGYTLFKAKNYLQCPFYFISCDTLFKESIPKLNCNWVGYSKKNETKDYRTIKIVKNKVEFIHKKNISKATNNAYIGLAFIYDYQLFWENYKLERKIIEEGEVSGLNNLIERDLIAIKFNWNDTGNPKELERTRKALVSNLSLNILDKENEDIWFINKKVIKYSKDSNFIINRVKRAEYIKEFIPKIINSSSNMFSYEMAQGKVISSIITKKLFLNLLEFSKSFWKTKSLEIAEEKEFKNICLNFYKEKTYTRMNQFFKKYPNLEGVKYINNEKIMPIYEIIENLNWDYLCQGKIGQFHGDFHFENILFNEKENRFIFLDWRQDFGGNIKFGDIYYDLAKLMHGLIIDHEIILENKFNIEINSDKLFFNFYRKFSHVECEKEFAKWLESNNYEIEKVYLLTSLIYLNIASLHHYPYDHLLFGLGYYMLWNLNKKYFV